MVRTYICHGSTSNRMAGALLRGSIWRVVYCLLSRYTLYCRGQLTTKILFCNCFWRMFWPLDNISVFVFGTSITTRTGATIFSFVSETCVTFLRSFWPSPVCNE